MVAVADDVQVLRPKLLDRDSLFGTVANEGLEILQLYLIRGDAAEIGRRQLLHLVLGVHRRARDGLARRYRPARTAEAEVRRVRIGLRHIDLFDRHMEHLGRELRRCRALPHAGLREVTLDDHGRAAPLDVADDAHEGFGVVLGYVGVADDAHTDADRFAPVLLGRHEPALPLFIPAEEVGRLLHRLPEHHRRA